MLKVGIGSTLSKVCRIAAYRPVQKQHVTTKAGPTRTQIEQSAVSPYIVPSARIFEPPQLLISDVERLCKVTRKLLSPGNYCRPETAVV